ncbi:MAG: D-alanine--D-alanine ligase [Thermodesulfobacteriota bacterium]
MRTDRHPPALRGLKKKRVGVLMGGLSEEREISLLTGRAVLEALIGKGYNATGIDVGRDVAAALKRKKIEVAFLALHGRYGEDGCVQGMLEVMGIPYTGSGVQASAVAMDKAAAKKLLAFHGVPTPEFRVVDRAADAAALGLPVVIKPASQGSAVGVSVVRDAAGLEKALRAAGRLSGEVIAERYVEGRELTVSILDAEPLPVVEILPKKGFYDFKAKYTPGMTEFVVPAALKKTVERRVVAASLRSYEVLGCRGAARVDVMLDGKGKAYVLEVNTIPGLTELSLFPRAAAAAGLDYPALVERMLRGAGLEKR